MSLIPFTFFHGLDESQMDTDDDSVTHYNGRACKIAILKVPF
jgi:hypothetical protein